MLHRYGMILTNLGDARRTFVLLSLPLCWKESNPVRALETVLGWKLDLTVT
jgi:hypothetical protein